MRHEGMQIGGIAGEQLIARCGHQDDQCVDGVAGTAGPEQLTRRTGVAQPGAAYVDHGQQPGEASLPSTSPPRLSDYRSHRDECGSRPTAELDQPGHPPIIPVQGNECACVTNEVQAADSSVRPGGK